MFPVPPLTVNSRIFVAGHRGMVGSAIVRFLTASGHKCLITRTHRELDLMDQQAVRHFFRSEPIDYVVLAAAKVGGILANNTYRADFIYQNLMIECNVIHEAFQRRSPAPAVSGKLLHLPKRCASAHERGISSFRSS